MEFIYTIFKDFILNKSKSLGQRFGWFVLIIIGLFFADRITNFTYDVHVNNKINAIEKINQLKKEYKSDSAYITKLNYLENEYKGRNHYYDYCNSFFNSSVIFIKSIFSKDKKILEKSKKTKNKIINTNHIRSDFWMILSSNFFFILACIFIILTMIFGKETNTKDAILGIILIFIILIVIMSVATWTAYLIPVFFNLPLLNYILNFIIHSAFVILFTRMIIKSTIKSST